MAAERACRSWELISPRVAAGLLWQTLAEAGAASWSILDSGPLLFKWQRKIQFRNIVVSSLGIILAAALARVRFQMKHAWHLKPQLCSSLYLTPLLVFVLKQSVEERGNVQSEKWKGQTSAFKPSFLVLRSRILQTTVLSTVNPGCSGCVGNIHITCVYFRFHSKHGCQEHFLSQICRNNQIGRNAGSAQTTFFPYHVFQTEIHRSLTAKNSTWCNSPPFFRRCLPSS